MTYRLGILLSSLVVFLASPALATVTSEYTCRMKFQPAFTPETDCVDPVIVESFPGDDAVVSVDMDGDGGPYSCMTVELVVFNPADWLVNIGNSPTNDGFGGDAGTTTEDAELEVLSPPTANRLRTYTNDNTPGGPAQPILTIDDFAKGFSKLTFEVDDSNLHVVRVPFNVNACVESDFMYRRTANDVYHVGINRSIANAARIGKGVWIADFNLSSEPCVCVQ